MSDYELNLLPFHPLKEDVVIAVSRVERPNYAQISGSQLPREFLAAFQLDQKAQLWWNLGKQDDDIGWEINLTRDRRFAKHFYNRVLFGYFRNQGFIVNKTFIRDTEVFIPDEAFHHPDLNRYNRFTLRFDQNGLIDGLSLLVAFDGTTLVHKKVLSDLGLEESDVSKVMHEKRVMRIADATEEPANEVYPVLNLAIRRKLKISLARNYSENKYKKSYDYIHGFYESHLRDKEISGYIKFVGSGFYRPHSERVNVTSDDSNLLVFGRNRTNFTPYVGIKEYGPAEPVEDKKTKLIFIFHEDDRAFANKLYSYLKKGYKSFPGLESFVNLPFDLDTANSIKFTDDPVASVEKALAGGGYDTASYHYGAFYISRIHKDSCTPEEHEIYFRLKEKLIAAEITSQVIYKENIDSPSFNYFLPNISVALLAKLGGVPWRLYRPVKSDLVIGVGADRNSGGTYIGSAFCFRNDGHFQGFNVFEKGDTEALAQAIRDAIASFASENEQFSRLVIHYYKSMSFAEEKPIREVLRSLDISLPYVVVTVNETESKDYVLFDTSFDGRMPVSGAFIKLRRDEYLLCNNSRYSRSTGTRIENFPFPIKIRFKSPNGESLEDTAVVRELIDQVYQFSRMYWKSVRQRSLPVTIEYSKLVAEMVSSFDNKELASFGRTSLWFL